ncbi:MAG TPA: CotH kinase family protein, partial [Flavobacteriales bacterium]|nr:CotH kinase family protein [Flavobacteriales bacterium]
MDVDGFLCYMAAQIILANTDWPEQNLKWWRWTGTPDTLGGPGDGRWRFIMTDSDLGMGLTVPPNYDMFAHIDRHAAVPVVRLLKACLRSTLLKDRFARILDELLAGPLSADRMTAEVERMRDAISLEMPVHIGRWRRPGSVEEWNDHVEELLTFAAQRPAAVKARSAIWLARYPLRP